MNEQQRGRRAIEVGPTGRTVASNIARLRERSGLTTRQLASALDRAGRPIPASGITRMEKGERLVTTDDLVALAVVFGVTPLALLLPQRSYGYAGVQLTDKTAATLDQAWDWAAGLSALPTAPGGSVSSEEQSEYRARSLPEARRHIAQHPAGQAVRDATEVVHRLILGAETVSMPDMFGADVDYAKSALTRVNAEVDHLKLTHDRFREDMREIMRQGGADWEQHVRDHPGHGHGAAGSSDG